MRDIYIAKYLINIHRNQHLGYWELRNITCWLEREKCNTMHSRKQIYIKKCISKENVVIEIPWCYKCEVLCNMNGNIEHCNGLDNNSVKGVNSKSMNSKSMNSMANNATLPNNNENNDNMYNNCVQDNGVNDDSMFNNYVHDNDSMYIN